MSPEVEKVKRIELAAALQQLSKSSTLQVMMSQRGSDSLVGFSSQLSQDTHEKRIATVASLIPLLEDEAALDILRDAGVLHTLMIKAEKDLSKLPDLLCKTP